MTRLEAAVRRLFEPLPPPGPPQVGLEAEFLVLRRGAGTPVLPEDGPDGPGTLQALRVAACSGAWTPHPAAAGLPRFRTPSGGVVSFEPGGQIEYATPPHTDLEALDRDLRETVAVIEEAAGSLGIQLVARGLDPVNPLARATLVLSGTRYPRQLAHYDRKGRAGRTMMLQTAALHINLDFGGDPAAGWGAANSLTPLLVAAFANAPQAGDPAGPRSARSLLWRTLDPSRTGVFPPSSDPSGDYLRFALEAESFLLGEAGRAPRAFRSWVGRMGSLGARELDVAVEAHLTTLFPEVRPRRYLEIRSVDALPAEWCIVPAAVTLAAIHDRPTRDWVLSELPPATEARLRRAATDGLGDPGLSAEAEALAHRIPDALERMGVAGRGPGGEGEGVADRVARYLDTMTLRGRDPAGVVHAPGPGVTAGHASGPEGGPGSP